MKTFYYLIISFFVAFSVRSEITPDQTMGTNVIKDNQTTIVKDGTIKGANLFHSFETFNVMSGESVVFAQPSTQPVKPVENIISRVTDGTPSWIDGTISSLIPNANIYLLNPAGMMIGKNAVINIEGSFFLSSADYVRTNQEYFYTDPKNLNNNNSILLSETPQTFGFSDDSIAQITIEGQGQLSSPPSGSTGYIKVSEGKSISIIGGDIDIKQHTRWTNPETGTTEFVPNMNADSGRIDILSASSKGEIACKNDTIEMNTAKGQIVLDNAYIQTSGNSSGKIFIRSGKFVLTDSTIAADTQGNQAGRRVDIGVDSLSMQSSRIFSDTKGYASGGSIYINASLIQLNQSRIFADVSNNETPGGLEKIYGGNVYLVASNIFLSNQSIVSSDTFGNGNGGNVTLFGTQAVSISGQSSVMTVAESIRYDTGNGGNITIRTPYFSLSDNSIVSCDTKKSSGNGGEIIMTGIYDNFDNTNEYNEYIDNVIISGSKIFSGAIDGTVEKAGNGGQVTIKGKQVTFMKGSIIGSESTGSGKGGEVNLLASDSLRLYGVNNFKEASHIYTSALSPETYAGNAGNININADQIVLEQGTGIMADTVGYGQAGVISVSAKTMLDMKSNSNITTSTKGTGKAGNIEINSDLVKLDFGAKITSASENYEKNGDAGTITININKTLDMNRTGIISTSTNGQGNAGKITINASNIEMSLGSTITSSSRSEKNGGNAGMITIKSEIINIKDNPTSIQTSSLGQGNAGNIAILSNRLNLTSNASISSESLAKSDGGNAGMIMVAAQEITIASKSSVTTEAVNTKIDINSINLENDKNNGRISILCKNTLNLSDSHITSSVLGGLGNGGDIDIDPEFIIMNHSGITANAYQGNGGNIHIIVKQLIRSYDSKITASSKFGLDGSIRIEAPDINLSSGLITLPSSFLDATQWIATPCALREGDKVSRFVINRRDTAPPSVKAWRQSPVDL